MAVFGLFCQNKFMILEKFKIKLEIWQRKKRKRTLRKMLGGIAEPEKVGMGKFLFLYYSKNQVKNQGGIVKMSMTIEQMRAEVARLYSGLGWKERVAKMSDKQILAIYNRQVLGKASAGGGARNGH